MFWIYYFFVNNRSNYFEQFKTIIKMIQKVCNGKMGEIDKYSIKIEYN